MSKKVDVNAYYFPESRTSMINYWVFSPHVLTQTPAITPLPLDTQTIPICHKSCPVRKYHAEWIFNCSTKSFHLYVKKTEELKEEIVATNEMSEVIFYCLTHMHPTAI